MIAQSYVSLTSNAVASNIMISFTMSTPTIPGSPGLGHQEPRDTHAGKLLLTLLLQPPLKALECDDVSGEAICCDGEVGVGKGGSELLLELQ